MMPSNDTLRDVGGEQGLNEGGFVFEKMSHYQWTNAKEEYTIGIVHKMMEYITANDREDIQEMDDAWRRA